MKRCCTVAVCNAVISWGRTQLFCAQAVLIMQEKTSAAALILLAMAIPFSRVAWRRVNSIPVLFWWCGAPFGAALTNVII